MTLTHDLRQRFLHSHLHEDHGIPTPRCLLPHSSKVHRVYALGKYVGLPVRTEVAPHWMQESTALNQTIRGKKLSTTCVMQMKHHWLVINAVLTTEQWKSTGEYATALFWAFGIPKLHWLSSWDIRINMVQSMKNVDWSSNFQVVVSSPFIFRCWSLWLILRSNYSTLITMRNDL